MNEQRAARFSWMLCLAFAPVGVIFAALTIGGFLGPTATGRVALGLLVGTGWFVGWLAPGRPLVHGFLAGFLLGLLAVETQALFLTTYFRNNPDYAGLEMPFGLEPRVATAVLGPVNALVAGGVAAAVAWVAARLGPPLRAMSHARR